MITLAFDTTAKTVTAALCRDKDLLAFYTADGKITHTETLMPVIDRLLKLSSLTVDDIGLIAVSAGPGSFTGVRIGVAVAKGLAFGRDIPCVGVSSLEALATNMNYTSGSVCAAMDARRSQLYCAFFYSNRGKIERLSPDSALSAEETARLAGTFDFGGYHVIGDGAEIASRALKAAGFSVRRLHPLLARQCAYSVALCGLAAYKAGRAVSAADLSPVYLRAFSSDNANPGAGNPKPE